jgi:hypothetical protein
MRVTRDVLLSERTDGEWIAMSREAGVLDETVVVESLDDGTTHAAKVVESRPVMSDGAVRHRLWLRRIDERDGERLNQGRR